MAWEKLLYPSIQLAKYGFKLDYHNIKVLNSDRYNSFLSRDMETEKIFTKHNNSPFNLNEVFIQSDLAHTLLRIAKYESGTEMEDDDTIEIDFSKVKKLFKRKKTEKVEIIEDGYSEEETTKIT